MSSLQKLAGRNWSDWEQNLDNDKVSDMQSHYPNLSDHKIISKARYSNSTLPCKNSNLKTGGQLVNPQPKDDAMKLPIKDMNIFGLCPASDDLVLVDCDICQSSVKIEAFEFHIKIRHKQHYDTVKKAIKICDEKQRLSMVQSKVTSSKKPRSDPVIPKITKSNHAKKSEQINLYYTNYHPKPLALCIFGSKRIGGLLSANRNKFHARRLIKATFHSRTREQTVIPPCNSDQFTPS